MSLCRIPRFFVKRNLEAGEALTKSGEPVNALTIVVQGKLKPLGNDDDIPGYTAGSIVDETIDAALHEVAALVDIVAQEETIVVSMQRPMLDVLRLVRPMLDDAVSLLVKARDNAMSEANLREHWLLCDVSSQALEAIRSSLVCTVLQPSPLMATSADQTVDVLVFGSLTAQQRSGGHTTIGRCGEILGVNDAHGLELRISNYHAAETAVVARMAADVFRCKLDSFFLLLMMD